MSLVWIAKISGFKSLIDKIQFNKPKSSLSASMSYEITETNRDVDDEESTTEFFKSDEICTAWESLYHVNTRRIIVCLS